MRELYKNNVHVSNILTRHGTHIHTTLAAELYVLKTYCQETKRNTKSQNKAKNKKQKTKNPRKTNTNKQTNKQKTKKNKQNNTNKQTRQYKIKNKIQTNKQNTK